MKLEEKYLCRVSNALQYIEVVRTVYAIIVSLLNI